MSVDRLNETKTYLGDGVYARYDGMHIVLTTENGMKSLATIYLEEEVFQSLLLYVERLFGVKITIKKATEGKV